MSLLLFVHPDDNLASEGTWTPSTQSADTDYQTPSLYDNNPAKVFRMDATSGNLVIDFGVATLLQGIALIHTNLDEDLPVRVQAHPTDVWTSPDINVLSTAPAAYRDGFRANLFIDLRDVAAAKRYYRLYFPTANSLDIEMCQVILAAEVRELEQLGTLDDDVERPLIEHQTDYRVSTIYSLGIKQRQLTGRSTLTPAGLVTADDWWDACDGRARPTLIVPDADHTDLQLREPWFVRWTEMRRATERRENHAANYRQMAWTEVSRGLRLD